VPVAMLKDRVFCVFCIDKAVTNLNIYDFEYFSRDDLSQFGKIDSFKSEIDTVICIARKDSVDRV
jgi:hypothetical protein